MRQEKQFLLDEIKEKIDSSSAFVMFNYEKLGANEVSDFRGKLDGASSELEVVRKRVFLKALLQAGIEIKEEMLKGHVGVVFSKEDPLAPLKMVYELKKESEASIDVLGGHFDEKVLSKDEVETLSKLPGINEMRAQLIGLFTAPMSKTLSIMNALMTSVPRCLLNKVEKEEGKS